MAINYKNINYGLPGHYTKLPIRKVPSKKKIYSKTLFKNVELFNPDPMPYQKDAFKACTVSRFVDIPRRVNDGFMINDDLGAPRQRGIILHKDRYDWSSMKEVLSNQNERLAAEENYVRKAKFLKRLSEQKLKSANCNLILEGEKVLHSNSSEKIETRKERTFHIAEDDSFKHPAPTMNSNYDDTLENIDLQQPVSMGVHQIKLKFRQFAGENISSAPALKNKTNSESMPNMYIPPDGRDSYDRLPPINSKQKEVDQSFFNLGESPPDFNYAFRQSERVNRPNVRLNEYVVDGVPVKFIERADIQAELKCLKSLALPITARDLFIGRGIHLPSNHATKNPRGRNIDETSYSHGQIDHAMKFETSSGGSVTINSKTPTNRNLSPENTPTLAIDLPLENINDDVIELENISELDTVEEFNIEGIFEFLSPNEDGLVDTVKLIEYLNGVRKLLDHEKRLLIVPLQSADKVTSGQVNTVLNTVKIIIDSNQSFRDSLISMDYEKIKPLFPQFLISLDPSKGPINATRFYKLLIESTNPSLTVDNCNEIYLDFQKKIESVEKVNEDEIIPSHILLLIPFLFLTI